MRSKGRGVSVYHAGSTQLLPLDVLRAHGIAPITVGLDTVHDLDEQRRRVGRVADRTMTPEDLAAEQHMVRHADHVLCGDAETVRRLFLQLVDA